MSDPVDMKLLLEDFNDKDQVVELLQKFSSDLDSRIAKLEKAFKQQRLDEAANGMHTLKGTAGNFCAMRIARLAQKMEREIRNGSDVKKQFRQLKKESDLVQRYIKNQTRNTNFKTRSK
jgi:HPt (histidine-containing phosphotransfer) domain-containing protein